VTQLERLKKSLEERYSIPLDVFLGLYMEGYTRDEMREVFDCTGHTLRQIAATLNLRWGVKHRASDFALMQTRDQEDTTSLADEVIFLQEEVKAFEHDLNLKERALIRVRREATRLRAAMREEAIDEAVIAHIKKAITGESLPQLQVTPTITTGQGIDFAVLSDLHAGAVVDSKDVPDNAYNWGILNERLDRLFNNLIINRENNHLHLYLLGDMLDGLIHDSLESADKSPAEAAKDLAITLSSSIVALKEIYPQVSIYCLNGNHSRMTEKIKSTAKGFDFEFLMYSIMEAYIGSLVDHFEISTIGMIAAEVGPGVFAGLHHGDNFRGASNNSSRDLQILERFRQIGPEVGHLIQGHTHIYESHVLPTGGFGICNGSMIGTNAYVHTNGFIPVSSVQVIGSWTADGQLNSVKPIIL